MEVLSQTCCGLDVHVATVVACVRHPTKGGRRKSDVRTFGTTTAELLQLADWLTEQGVTHVAMESTGVLWKPVFNILEGNFAVTWLMPATSKRSRAARPMCATVSGSRNC